MSEAEYITPTTWEECARHVEAGGIVEVKVGEWHAQHSPPSAYRSLIGSPPPSLPRRLVPIEPVGGYEATIVELDEASDWMGPAMTTTIDVPDPPPDHRHRRCRHRPSQHPHRPRLRSVLVRDLRPRRRLRRLGRLTHGHRPPPASSSTG